MLPDGQPGSQPGGPRLWDQEPSLWEEARRYRLIRPLSPVFGCEGPSGGAFGREYSRQPGWKFTEGIDLAETGAAVAPPGPEFAGPLGDGVNITNGRVYSSFWGTPDRMVFSIGKTDVFNRAAMHMTSSMKPVGQLVILAEDFAGTPQPEVSTTVHDGVHRPLRRRQGRDLAIHLSERLAFPAHLPQRSRPDPLRGGRQLQRDGE